MLTLELLNQTPSLKDLSPDQKEAIIEASKNDESRVIGMKVGEIHGMYQSDIETVLGTQKPEGWKSSKGTSHTYEWLKEDVLPGLKKSANQTGLKTENDRLKKEKSELEEQIKKGTGDQALKDKLTVLEKKINDSDSIISKLRADAKNNEQTWQEKLSAEAKKNESFKVDAIFEKALAGKTFKPGIPQESIDALIEVSKQKILALGTPEFTEAGGMVLRDANNMIITNPKNLHKPFTGDELFIENLAPIIDAGKKQAGAGTKSGGDDGGGGTTLDMSGVTSKVAADKAIRKHLGENGFVAGTPKYQEEFAKIRKEINVSDLPTTE